MTKKWLGSTAAVVMVVGGLVVSSLAADNIPLLRVRPKKSSGMVKKQQTPGVGKDIPQGPFAITPMPKVPQFAVMVNGSTPAHLRDLHANIADRITTSDVPVPAHRVQQFRWLDDPRFQLLGWGGTVESVEATENGHVATLFVYPRVMSTLGASTTVLSVVREQFAVNGDGTVTYLKSLDGVDAAPMTFLTD